MVWRGSGVRISSSYETSVLSKARPEKTVTLQVTKNDISASDPVKIKVYHFFQKGSYSGKVKIEMLENNIPELEYSQDIIESIELPVSGQGYQTHIPFKYKARISVDIGDEKDYAVYLGSVMVAEVIR